MFFYCWWIECIERHLLTGGRVRQFAGEEVGGSWRMICTNEIADGRMCRSGEIRCFLHTCALCCLIIGNIFIFHRSRMNEAPLRRKFSFKLWEVPSRKLNLKISIPREKSRKNLKFISTSDAIDWHKSELFTWISDVTANFWIWPSFTQEIVGKMRGVVHSKKSSYTPK